MNAKRKEKLKEGEIIPICFNDLFCTIFNDEKNIDILEKFLECWFEKEDGYFKGNVKLVNRELITEHKKERDKQIDLLVKFEDQFINIELNSNINKAGIIDRNVVFACKVHSRALHYGDNNYSKIGKTIQINLDSNYSDGPLKERYFLKNEDNKILTDKLEIDFLDLTLGSRICYDKSSKYYHLARWCKLFTTNNKEELEKVLGEDLMSNNSKEKLVDKVDEYSSDYENIQIYTGYSKQEMEYNTIVALKDEAEKKLAEAEKNAEAKAQEKLKESAINLHKNGVSDEIITKSLNMRKNQLESYLKDVS